MKEKRIERICDNKNDSLILKQVFWCFKSRYRVFFVVALVLLNISTKDVTLDCEMSLVSYLKSELTY